MLLHLVANLYIKLNFFPLPIDLTVQATSLLTEKFSSQAKKLINLSKTTMQSALEIQQKIVPSMNSKCFFCCQGPRQSECSGFILSSTSGALHPSSIKFLVQFQIQVCFETKPYIFTISYKYSQMKPPFGLFMK